MKTQGNNQFIGREDLKKYFRNGEVPNENHFEYLIDSMINKQDDAFLKDKKNGFVIASSVESNRFLSLYKNINDLHPFFCIEKDEQGVESLRINPVKDRKNESEDTTDKDDKNTDENSFYFDVNGNLGIGKRSLEGYKLEVAGFAGMNGRLGTFKSGKVAADGKWHDIIEGLDNCNAFEIVARTGLKGTGKFAIVHAIAMSTFGGRRSWLQRIFGGSRNRIRRTSAHYGFIWNRLRLRWKGETNKYSLQIKTSNNYGKDADDNAVEIYYNITKLWDDEMRLPPKYYNEWKNDNSATERSKKESQSTEEPKKEASE